MGETVVCGGDTFDWPDVGNHEVPCCMGAAEYGPHRCTCWEPVFDRDQTDPAPAPPGLRSSACVDCAYRGGSPERLGAEHVAADVDDLQDLVTRNQPFFCHQGIRRPTGYRHPNGTEWRPPAPALDAAYSPPIHAGVPYKADGTPADLCAGWATARLRQENSNGE